MKEGLFIAHSCRNCKHCLVYDRYFNPSFDAVMLKTNDSPVLCYCNIAKDFPGDPKKFVELCDDGERDPNNLTPIGKWFDILDEDDPISSTKFTGFGNLCCADWERDPDIEEE